MFGTVHLFEAPRVSILGGGSFKDLGRWAGPSLVERKQGELRGKAGRGNGRLACRDGNVRKAAEGG